MAQQYPDFDELQRSFQEKLANLKAEQESLARRATDLKPRFDALWQRFLVLGYAENESPEDSGPMTREAYRDHLQEDIRKMDGLLSEIAEGNEDQAEPCQRHIATMFDKLDRRWATILESQGAAKNDFVQIAEKKQEYVTQFTTNTELSGLEEQERQELLMRFLMLFEEEDRIMKQTEFYLVELNHLLEVKERLLAVSTDLLRE